MAKRMIFMLVAVFVFAAAIGFWKFTIIRAGMAMGAKMAPPPASVTTVVVQPQKWQPVLSAVGSLRAVNGVTVSTDLAGIVSQIAFESGTPVKKGALLVALDTQQEDAQLRSAQARLGLAKTDLERKRDLVKKSAVAQSDLDTAESMLSQTQASVEEMKALIGRKRIEAPFDGVAGIRQVNLGQYVNPGAPIVPLQSLDPIYVEFALPQQHLGVVAPGKKLRLGAEGIGGEQFGGEITALDSRVDESTRNFTVQGTIKNPEHKLRPGMFVNVEVLLPQQQNVLAIPSSSINFAPYSDSVFVVKDAAAPAGTPAPSESSAPPKPAPATGGKPAKEVVEQIVKLGPARGDQVEVLSGVKAGDEIVTSGVFKLRSHAPVFVNNSVQPGNALVPKVPET